MSGLFDQIVNYSPPLLTAGQVNYKGTWNAATNTPGLVNPPDALSKGDYYVVSAAGTQFSISFAVGDWIISNGTAWEKVDLTDAVSSVFGRTGAVVGVSTDYSAVGITNTAIGAANPASGAFTSLSSSSTTTLNGTTVPASKTLVVTTDKLSALAATTSAELAGVISDETGSGALVFATSPTLVSPALGAATATSISASGTVTGSNLSGTNTGDQTITLTGGVTGSGTGSFAATVVTNANLTGVITSSGNATSIASQTGTGTKFVVDTSPTLVTPILGTPQSGTLTSCTGLPISTGVSGLGTGIATALAVNTGSAGAPVLFNGALGTPTSGTVTNLTGTASININGTVGATTPSTLSATTGLFTGDITRNGAVSVRAIKYQTSGVDRWYAYVNGTAESGSNQGSSYAIGRFNDAGTFVANSLLFDRTDGSATFEGKVAGAFNGTIGATTPSTGAFTTLSASGDVTLSATSNLVANKSVLVSDGTAGTATGAIYFINDTDTGFYRAGGNTLGFMGNGASLGTWSPTGLAVTGALSATGLFSLTGGSLAQIASFNSTNANGIYQTFNTNGTAIGDIGSGFQTITGSASDFGITSRGGNLVFGTGSSLRATLSSSGLAVTGALSSTGALAIGNTVNTVSPTSPNRTVTIVISGTTYYLAAKTTND